MLSIGLMSGTSMDGIDCAMLKTDGSENEIIFLGNISLNYEPPFKKLLKAAEFAVRKYKGDLKQAEQFFEEAILEYFVDELKIENKDIQSHLLACHAYLYLDKKAAVFCLKDVIHHSTYLHGSAVKRLLHETGYEAAEIDVVGYHGQTLFHQPSQGISVIVGDGQYLADYLGITVVNDFRRQDIAAGGQGAPFAPLYHFALSVRDNKIPVAVVNCGGIANITIIPNANELDMIAFDTGPGNGLIDRLIRQRTSGELQLDRDGIYGQKGKVDEQVLKALYQIAIKEGENYFNSLPPKSLDIGDLKLIAALDDLSIEDAARTLEAFTADTIVNSLNHVSCHIPQHWVLAGGGWHNPVIVQEFANRLSQKIQDPVIHIADEIGWDSAAMEAQIFAYLAVRSLQHKHLSLPGTTRVPFPQTGGQVYYAI